MNTHLGYLLVSGDPRHVQFWQDARAAFWDAVRDSDYEGPIKFTVMMEKIVNAPDTEGT